MTDLGRPPVAVPAGWTPDCFTAVELAAWQEAAEVVQAERGVRPCIDCTATFAAEQWAAGCCNGTPPNGLPRG